MSKKSKKKKQKEKFKKLLKKRLLEQEEKFKHETPGLPSRPKKIEPISAPVAKPKIKKSSAQDSSDQVSKSQVSQTLTSLINPLIIKDLKRIGIYIGIFAALLIIFTFLGQKTNWLAVLSEKISFLFNLA